MPHPFFGAKDVCYIEKKVAKKKAVLGEASLYDTNGEKTRRWDTYAVEKLGKFEQRKIGHICSSL